MHEPIEVTTINDGAIPALFRLLGDLEEAIYTLPQTVEKETLRIAWGALVAELGDSTLFTHPNSADHSFAANYLAAELLAKLRQLVRMLSEVVATADERVPIQGP